MTPRMSAWHEGHVMGGYQNPKCNECRREQRGPMTTEEYKMVDPVPRPPVDPRTADVERAIAIVNDSRLTHVHWRDWRRSGHGTDEDHEMVGDLTHHEEAIADYDHVLRVLHAYRAALHPVSDATPDLAAALAILRAHHGNLGDDEHLDEAIHHLSHAVAIRKMDTLASEPVPAATYDDSRVYVDAGGRLTGVHEHRPDCLQCNRSIRELLITAAVEVLGRGEVSTVDGSMGTDKAAELIYTAYEEALPGWLKDD